MYSYDIEYVNEVYAQRFDRFLNNVINLGFGNGIPIVKYAKSTEVVGESAYTPLVVKLAKPLDQDVEINTRFYISGLYYSDDLYYTTILNKTSKVATRKLRQPNLTLVSTSRGTKEYNQEDLIENVSGDVAAYFNTSATSDLSLNVDYSDFNNFVKYSSAKSRIDSFLFKITNYSVISHKIKNIEKEIYNLQYETSIGNIEAKISENSVRLLRTLEIAKEKEKQKQILTSLDGYERYLFFENKSDDATAIIEFNNLTSITNKPEEENTINRNQNISQIYGFEIQLPDDDFIQIKFTSKKTPNHGEISIYDGMQPHTLSSHISNEIGKWFRRKHDKSSVSKSQTTNPYFSFSTANKIVVRLTSISDDAFTDSSTPIISKILWTDEEDTEQTSLAYTTYISEVSTTWPRTNNLQVSGIEKNQDTFGSVGWANGVYEPVGFFNNQREFKHRISNFYIFYEVVYNENNDDTFGRWVVSNKQRTTINSDWFTISNLHYINSELKIDSNASGSFMGESVSVGYENILNSESILKRMPEILPENVDEFAST